ncbi:hypothetical protein ABT294_43670 [Nonomuraea sp. NPDC000554]|uniref:hypothetical protein n=1 Tax=Nonomuraea sp. NPDC000554 TaxID=3154259 RepID=UPI00333345AB
MATGILLAGAGLAVMAAIVSVGGGYLSFLPGMLAMGIGMGLSMTPSTEAITSALPQERQGVASALNDVTREFGTALGVALLGALLSSGTGAAVMAALFLYVLARGPRQPTRTPANEPEPANATAP